MDAAERRLAENLLALSGPAAGQPTAKLPAGRYHRLMRLRFDYRYGQRWQVETVVSMIKRRLGRYTAGRRDAARARDTMLKVLTHNLRLIVPALIKVFYGANLSPHPVFILFTPLFPRRVAETQPGRGK